MLKAMSKLQKCAYSVNGNEILIESSARCMVVTITTRKHEGVFMSTDNGTLSCAEEDL
jgi:hypothetical protein